MFAYHHTVLGSDPGNAPLKRGDGRRGSRSDRVALLGLDLDAAELRRDETEVVDAAFASREGALLEIASSLAEDRLRRLRIAF